MDEPHSTEDAADHQVQSLRGYELEPGGGKARKKSLCRGNSEGIRQIYGKKLKFVRNVHNVRFQNVIVYHGRTA